MEDSPDGTHASDNERAARVGFAQGRVVWFGGEEWKEDWLFYLENEHTLVSMWRGHALHPFDRTDRVCYFVCVLCFSLFMSAYVQNEHPRSAGALEYAGWLTLSSILLVAYDYGLRFFATSPCLQPGGCLYGFCWLCRDCCIDAGRQGLYICLAGSAGFLVAGIVLAATANDVNPRAWFLTWACMKAASYIAELAPLAYTFYAARRSQKLYWLDGETGGPYPLGRALPDPIFLRESRRDGDARKWPDDSTPRQNPLLNMDQAARNDNAEKRRQKQIELLNKARDRVRAQQRPPDPLDALGSRA
ncbi:hypothetical protein CTAYLR_000618 [Chrysophaeum taylorii]|uniref:Uncharacterized protein n=1 Tax=Chrysophaeum taylorii TaxID=2483200 RepID=A0AAD7XI78_9STRA|nr:hypothetical protein CTAYLR_000618 [Chrysophaeum taylorii]